MGYLDGNGLSRVWSKIKAFATNAASKVPYGELDNTSTATVMTATVPGITELVDGTCCYLRNNVVTSAANFTININNLGAKRVYTNLAAATAETTKFNINYTMLFIYNEDRVEGGCWDCYNGYDSNTNTVGYQIRTNASTRPSSDKFYRYRMLFTSADGTKWVPANTSTSTNATASRQVNQRPIDPWGDIVYYSSTTIVNANANVGTGSIWQQYSFAFGYSFNRTGAALVLPYPSPIYIKCTPQANGSAIIDPDTPYVTSLPSTEDGKIYIYIGRSYNATYIELVIDHPVYYYKDNAIRIWTNPASTGGGGAVTSVNGQTGTVVLDANDVGALPDNTVIPSAATATPLVDGTAAVGSSSKYAKEDHVHPTDTSRQATLVSGTNIKTVNGNSLLGSGNIVVGGSPTPMTAQEIADAVDTGWLNASVYSITDVYTICRSITLDGTFGVNITTKATEATTGDTVTVVTSTVTPTIIGSNVGSIPINFEGSYEIQDSPQVPGAPPSPGTTYLANSFVMPNDDVEIIV